MAHTDIYMIKIYLFCFCKQRSLNVSQYERTYIYMQRWVDLHFSSSLGGIMCVLGMDSVSSGK